MPPGRRKPRLLRKILSRTRPDVPRSGFSHPTSILPPRECGGIFSPKGLDMRNIEFANEMRPGTVNPGPAPILQWIKIADLVVDDRYQRELKFGNWKAIRRIAGQFKWSRFSPVFVAPVEGGKFAIIDGQHRTHAAAICGFSEVPCQIVQMSIEEQAASFAAVNGLVTKVTLWQIYKAALTAGEKWAVDCANLCEEAGCELMTGNSGTDEKKPGEIYCVALIRAHVAQGHSGHIGAALAGLRKSEFGQDAAAYSNEVLKPLFAAMCERPWLAKQGVDLTNFFDEFDIWRALDDSIELAKQKRRQGAIGISRYDIAAANIGEGLDRAFPQRMALPSATVSA